MIFFEQNFVHPTLQGAFPRSFLPKAPLQTSLAVALWTHCPFGALPTPQGLLSPHFSLLSPY